MKADLSLAERERAGASDQRAIRAAFVRRHTEVLDEQHALEAAQLAIDIRGPEFCALAGRMRG